MTSISCKELNAQKDKILLLDVRTKEERNTAKILPSVWIPIDELEQRYTELDKKKEIVVYCHHGPRSEAAAEFLKQKGFNTAWLKGGIDAWSREIDSSVPQYQ